MEGTGVEAVFNVHVAPCAIRTVAATGEIGFETLEIIYSLGPVTLNQLPESFGMAASAQVQCDPFLAGSDDAEKCRVLVTNTQGGHLGLTPQ
ncbi:MAG: hypothetical protein ETSY2_26040 [Candidatus Entotheonella gemina]|uniref:Uncharacterized protein n=1 Tax=Candidatus Entotheonella gemina TaxID=1429439 RepID=W4M416_9BACT|nr:MAG: hypothetical protein ETSY2_26040 [Candidatus Entotheonella gemina]